MTLVVLLLAAACTALGLLAWRHSLQQGRQLAVLQAQLRAAEAMHRSVLSVLDEGIVVFDNAGQVQSYNRRAQEFFGPAISQLHDRNALLQWRPMRSDGSPLPLRELPLRHTLASGQPCRNVLVGVRPPGADDELPPRWLLIHAEPVHDEDTGQLKAVIASYADITESHEHEQQLRKLWLAVEQSPIGIVICDTRGRIEYVNEAWSQASGYSRDEALGRTRQELQPGMPPPPERAAMMQALLRGETWAGELSARRKNGEPYQESLRSRPIRQDDDRITHFLLMAEDVTASKRIAAELDAHRHHLQDLVGARTRELREANAQLVQARDRAEAANRARSAFLANTGHEIRTPMNAILGLTHLLQRELHDGVARARLQKIAEAGQRLMGVLDDILDLARIEAGKLQLAMTAFSLREVLDRCVAQVAERARSKGLHIEVDVQQIGDTLCGDAVRLAQALRNLLDNAVKFTDRGGVLLRVEALPGAADVGPRLRFIVQDSGVGIPAPQLDELFGAFVQGDDSTTRRYGGAGLGLAITQRLVRLMDGEVGASSQPGKGSSFWFTATFRPPPAAAGTGPAAGLQLPPSHTRLQQRCAGARVLLAEDNPINQEVARELLESVGLVVGLADDGARAVQMARDQHWDLVLMDLQMPGMDGLEAARAIRQYESQHESQDASRRAAAPPVPIVALTANVLGEDRNASLQAGMNGYVAKPVDAEQLYAELLRWLPAKVGFDAPGTAGPMAEGVEAGARPALPLMPLDNLELDGLQQLLAHDDFSSVARYRKLAAALQQRCAGAPEFTDLETALRSFDFPRALDALKALRGRGALSA